MSTILEMAQIVRAGGFTLEKKAKPRVVDVCSKNHSNLCNVFDTTPLALCCAIESVGADSSAVGRFLR